MIELVNYPAFLQVIRAGGTVSVYVSVNVWQDSDEYLSAVQPLVEGLTAVSEECFSDSDMMGGTAFLKTYMSAVAA